jgi:Fe-Mn family superoxide dismutase
MSLESEASLRLTERLTETPHAEPAAPSLKIAGSLSRRHFLKMAAMTAGTTMAGLSGWLIPSQAKGRHRQIIKSTPSANASTPNALQTKGTSKMPVLTAQAFYKPVATIEPLAFETRLATVEGISSNQLKQHIGLYEGYVKKINEIQTTLTDIIPDAATANATYNTFRELHVEQSFALNGVRLHELYFGNLGGDRAAPSELIKETFVREFHSWENYLTHLLALGKSMRGWALTAFNLRDGRIHNYGLDSHNQGTPFHVVPLLVLDVYEHAYMIDFGTRRAAYLEAFIRNVDWAVVDERLEMALAHHGAYFLK